MDKKEFCNFIFELRKGVLTRPEMEKKWPWHKNTILGYEKDRLPDIDYLYAISIETGFDFVELIKLRLKAGVLNLSDNFDLNLMRNESAHGIKSQALDSFKKINIQVSDDSMEPTIKKGAKISIDPEDKTLNQGSIYAIELNGLPVPRRVQFDLNGGVILLSENKQFSPLKVDKENLGNIEVLGRVTHCTNEL